MIDCLGKRRVDHRFGISNRGSLTGGRGGAFHADDFEVRDANESQSGF